MNYEEINKQCVNWKENILKWKSSDIINKKMCDYLKEMKTEIPSTENIKDLTTFITNINNVFAIFIIYIYIYRLYQT